MNFTHIYITYVHNMYYIYYIHAHLFNVRTNCLITRMTGYIRFQQYELFKRKVRQATPPWTINNARKGK